MCYHKFSDFMKEQLLIIHMAILEYLDSGYNEESFKKMKKVFNYRKYAIPQDLRYQLLGFIEYFIKVDLYGKEAIPDEECSSFLYFPEEVYEKIRSEEIHDEYTKRSLPLKVRYDYIASEFLHPIFVPEDDIYHYKAM